MSIVVAQEAPYILTVTLLGVTTKGFVALILALTSLATIHISRTPTLLLKDSFPVPERTSSLEPIGALTQSKYSALWLIIASICAGMLIAVVMTVFISLVFGQILVRLI